MAKFAKAYSISLEKKLTANEYNKYDNKNLTNDLECTICKQFTTYPAKLHLRHRDEYFYATNPKSIHHQDCKHYSQVTSKKIVDIIEKDNATEEDILLLDTLVEQKKKHLLKLMYISENEEKQPPKQNLHNTNLTKIKKEAHGKKSNKTTKYIEQRDIKYISNDEDCFDRPLAVYGEVIMKIKTHKAKDNRYSNKLVTLYHKSKIKLSIYILQNIADELKLSNGEYKIFFIGIGKINFKDNKYFNFNFYNRKIFLEFKLIENIKVGQ